MGVTNRLACYSDPADHYSTGYVSYWQRKVSAPRSFMSRRVVNRQS